MSSAARLQRESVFHDEQARERAGYFTQCPDRLKFTDDEYLDHESWIRPAFDELGPVHGLRVLDLGCGHGMASVVLARRGGQVIGCDVSVGYLAEARRRALANQVAVGWVKADGQRLPFPAGSFDRIWGNAVLHHLDMERAAGELRRVMAPGGRAVFCEPWGENPLLHLARRALPYPGKGRTPDETPLLFKDLALLKRAFPKMRVTGHQLLGMAGRFLGKMGFAKRLHRWDQLLMRRVPSLRRFCRYVVVVLEREAAERRTGGPRRVSVIG